MLRSLIFLILLQDIKKESTAKPGKTSLLNIFVLAGNNPGLVIRNY